MARQLLLMRHGEAEPSSASQNDQDRLLTQLGMRQAMVMGQILKKNNIIPDLILTSSAQRATATAGLLAEQLELDQENLEINEDIYESSVRILFRIVNELPYKKKTVLMVGHNPIMTHFYEYLTDDEVGNLTTAGILQLNCDVEKWEEVSNFNVTLEHYWMPEAYMTI